MKICSKCNKNKDYSLFYKHPRTRDGYLNKCKECSKNFSKKNYLKKSKLEEFMESERIRSRERYKRLGRDNSGFEKTISSKRSVYNNLNRDLRVNTGFEIHHWSYADKNIKDVFILKRKEHRKAHTFLKRKNFESEFTGLNGEYLDTKEKHIEYLTSKGIIF